MSQVSLGRPEFVPGTPPGHPTAKFLYVIFLYRFFFLSIIQGLPIGDSGQGVTPILSDLRRFCPIFAGVLQTLENKAPILFNFAPILSDLAFLEIRQNQTKSARPLRAVPFWEFPNN